MENDDKEIELKYRLNRLVLAAIALGKKQHQDNRCTATEILKLQNDVNLEAQIIYDIATKRKKHNDWWSENRAMRESPIGWQPRIGASKATIQRLEQAPERVNNMGEEHGE